MINDISLILPEFFVIIIGQTLARKFNFSNDFWKGAENLVFYVLFPPLLFTSIATSTAEIKDASIFLTAGIGAMLVAVILAHIVRYVITEEPVTHASIFQCGFRFNSYIGFAVCLQLFGNQGFALLAFLIAIWVPISNTIAVAVLARAVDTKESNNSSKVSWLTTIRSLFTNPLIIATILGLSVNLSDFEMPKIAMNLLQNLGSASLALGLLCIGAGLRTDDLRKHWKLIAVSTVNRLVVVPFIAFGIASYADLNPIEASVMVLFAALPTAQSCYVMTSAMRGNASIVADATTVQTLFAMISLPIWISVITNTFTR